MEEFTNRDGGEEVARINNTHFKPTSNILAEESLALDDAITELNYSNPK